MPLLANAKHELFAQNMASGMKVLDAYEAAGYPRNPSSASQLHTKPEVQTRIAELIEERSLQISRMAEAGGATSENTEDFHPDFQWVVRQLKKNAELAQQANQISAANKAIELIAEMYQFVGKKAKEPEVAKPPEKAAPSIADLAERLKGLKETQDQEPDDADQS